MPAPRAGDEPPARVYAGSAMKTLIVGDIHGCHAELLELLDRARLGPGDRLVSVGDVVNRGPETPQVLEFLLARPRTQVVLGNHEWKHLQGHQGESARITRRQCGPDLYARALNWMRGLPRCLDLGDLVVVHWGFESGLACADQNPEVLTGTEAGELYLTARYGSPRWYEHYFGPRKVVFGHHGYAAGVRDDLTWGIDGGCVYGGRLTGLLLPDWELITVPSREDHWSRLRAAWADRLNDPSG